MPRIILRRTGLPPLEFDGDTLTADSDGPLPPARGADRDRRGRDRWHSLALYRTAGGSLVVAVGWRSNWAHEPPRDDAYIAPTPRQVVDYLAALDPFGDWQGYHPRADKDGAKTQRLRAQVANRWRELVGRVLAAAGPEFREQA